jgi:hypothetical protein
MSYMPSKPMSSNKITQWLSHTNLREAELRPRGYIAVCKIEAWVVRDHLGNLTSPHEVESTLNTLTSYQVTEYWFAIDVQVLFPVVVMFCPVMLHVEDTVVLVPTGVVAGPGVNIVVGLPGGLVTL